MAGRSLAAKAGGAGAGPGKLNRPFRIAIAGDKLIALDARPQRVNVYDKKTAEFKTSFLYQLPQHRSMAGISLAPNPNGNLLVGAFIPEFGKPVDLVFEFDLLGNYKQSLLPREPIVDIQNIHLYAGVNMRTGKFGEVYAVQPSSATVFRLADDRFIPIVSEQPAFYRVPVHYPPKYLADDPKIQALNSQWTQHYAAFPLDEDSFLDVFYDPQQDSFISQVYTTSGQPVLNAISSKAKPLATDGDGLLFMLYNHRDGNDTSVFKIYRVRGRKG
ncbi:MAG: hypothetical protein IT169_05360 [Bryobacterales bacterium]|nr:hypothetical protein [Bryobacterales bacterium]